VRPARPHHQAAAARAVAEAAAARRRRTVRHDVAATYLSKRKVTMADKSSHKTNTKKVGKTLKEKRAAKKAKSTTKSTTIIAPTQR
jgi:ribosomal protein S12 methylthiotransferase accessory factor YcaO